MLINTEKKNTNSILYSHIFCHHKFPFEIAISSLKTSEYFGTLFLRLSRISIFRVYVSPLSVVWT